MQHDYFFSNQLGTDFRAELNVFCGAIATQNSGSSAPTTTYPFLYWVDTSNASTYYLKQRNHDDSDWQTKAEYDVDTKLWITSDASKQDVAPNYTGLQASNLASASTVNIGTATGDYIHITGTTTITAFDTVAAGVERTLVFDGALTLTHNATSLILPTGANITTAAGDTAIFRSEGSGNWRLVGGTIYTRVNTPTSSSASGVIQTVQSASVDSNGFANFMTAGTGLTVNVAATTTPIRIHAAGGNPANDRIGIISTDLTNVGSLTNNATNYIYFDVASNGACTIGSTTLAPTYQFGGTYSTTNLQNTYNISERTMKVGNGSTASQVYRVFTNEVVTSGGVVTSVVNYALNGFYVRPQSVAVNTAYSVNHNIGTTFLTKQIDFIFNRTIGQMVSGDIINNINTIEQSSYGNNKAEGKMTNKTYSWMTQSASVLSWITSSGTNATETSGTYLITIKRSW